MTQKSPPSQLVSTRRSTRASLRRRWLASLGVVVALTIAFAPGLASAAPSMAAAPHGGVAFVSPAIGHPIAVPTFSTHLSTASVPSPTGRVVFNAPGPRPGAWSASGAPPGAEALGALTPHAAGSGSWGSGGAGSAATWQNRFCTGVWPSFGGAGSQNVYASGCYGHDEPGIEFYSNLPGSGGNVTWNFSLPVDRSATLNQSSNYVAIWLGMTLTDPYAWMDQSFLELQFYPDQTFYNPGPLFPNLTVNGAWVAAAVVWQIQASTGAENPAFYQPMYLGGIPGPAFLNMTQGDQIGVSMTGWTASLTGEVLSIVDQSNGQTSNVTLFNGTGNYPLDPSYLTNNFENGLEWTPGGEYPVSFAFETGHGANGAWPENNSFGGCSPGPKSTPSDPGAPCPSYDPGLWANDTAKPWAIKVPTFSNAQATVTPAQVGFTQDFGGISLVSQLSGGACNGQAGAAWCSYPWWSFSCRNHAFTFGALDYTGVTSDFGKYNQFAQTIEGNALGFGFYAPTNFSIPTCANPSYTVTVGSSGGGSAYFLSHGYTAPTAVPGVGAGLYALNAINDVAGARFDHWSTSGAVSVDQPTSAYASLIVNGTGNVTAIYSATPRTTAVTFLDSPKGSVELDPGLTYNGPFLGTGNSIGTFRNGTSASLSAGIYSIQAYPEVGYNFTGWAVNNSGATIAASAFPYTWLVVSGTAATVTVTAQYTKTTVGAIAELEVVGNGTVTLGPLTVVDNGTPYAIGLAHPRVGTWPMTATPGVGNNHVEFLYNPSGVMSNFSMATHITLEQGLTFIEAVFYDDVPVAFTASGAGAISLIGSSGGPGANFTVDLIAGNYTVGADAFGGAAFGYWTSTGGVLVQSPSSVVTSIMVSGAGTVTAWFSTASTTSVHLGAKPWWGGSELFDGLSSITVPFWNSSVALGLHWASAVPAAGWVFTNWNTTGGVALVGGPAAIGQEFNVTGSGRLIPVFAPGVFPVTFVAWQPSGASLPSSATLTVSGTTIGTGETVWLAAGLYHATVSTGKVHVEHWTATSNLTLRNGNPAGVTIVVTGSVTVYALLGIHHGSGGGGGGTGGAYLGPRATTGPTSVVLTYTAASTSRLSEILRAGRP
ncbi:MAG: hypothetical protein L3K17_06405 [Thermoplasmata archaeon]|nr:hypothetical protein [Thermoplasmata archaeon]